QGAHAGCGKVLGRRCAEATGAKEQNARRQELLLAPLTDLGQQDVPRVTIQLSGSQVRGSLNRVPEVLPANKPGVRARDVLVPELGQGTRSEGAPRPTRAINDDLLVLIGKLLLRLHLEEAPGEVDSARNVPSAEF